MGHLDRTALQAAHNAQRLGLDHEVWLSALLAAHEATHEHDALMPYELAEIEESSLTLEEAMGLQDAAAARLATQTG